jgi:hypothetical protein
MSCLSPKKKQRKENEMSCTVAIKYVAMQLDLILSLQLL